MASPTQRQDILRHGFDEYGQFVNRLVAERARLTGEPLRIERAEGGRIVDAAGKTYEDLHGSQAFGHRHPAITRAVQEFLESDQVNWYPSRVGPHAGRFARRLCERTGYESVYFGLSGSDAVEASIKLARVATRRPRILGLERAYHGCGLGSTALMAAGPFRDPFGPHLPGVESLPFGDTSALARALEKGDVAAAIVEPIQGEGGVHALAPDYVAALCELTARHGALLVADEVQTGLGRTGRLLASETWPRRPDVVLLAKHLGGGLVPISAALTRRELFEKAYGADYEDGESHNVTFGPSSLGAVAGLAALDLVTDELLANVKSKGDAFKKGLEDALAGSPLVAEVRGVGLMVGIELRAPDHPWLSFEHFGYPALAGRSTAAPLLCHRLYKRGFVAYACGHDWNVIRLQPRFTVPASTLVELTVAIREELACLADLV